MNWIAQLVMIGTACLLSSEPTAQCIQDATQQNQRADTAVVRPQFTGSSIDVILTAQADIVWDVSSGEILHSHNETEQRPVASLSKLLSMLAVRSQLNPAAVVEIPFDAARAQRLGAHIKLPVGEHATVQDLLAASAIASANDAMVTLAIATSGSEEAFVEYANNFAREELGLENTQLANATGLSGGEQFSTAQDVQVLLTYAFDDPVIGPLLAREAGVLTTTEGTRREYDTTNDLLGTYVPIVAAKTGYTVEAGQNLAMITSKDTGQRIGAVVLGSDQRFQDMKILVEWIWRNYTWNTQLSVDTQTR